MSIAGHGEVHVLVLEYRGIIDEVRGTDKADTAQRWFDEWVEAHNIQVDQDNLFLSDQDFLVHWRQADSADITDAYLF